MLNFYLYSITAISLAIFYAASIIVVNGILQLAFPAGPVPPARQDTIELIAGALGFFLIALPLWWLHWRWLRAEFSRAEGSAVSWHRFYLFTIVCLNALAILLLGSQGISGAVRLSLGVVEPVGRTMSQTGMLLFALALSTLLWGHHWRQFKGGRGELFPPAENDLEPATQN